MTFLPQFGGFPSESFSLFVLAILFCLKPHQRLPHILKTPLGDCLLLQSCKGSLYILEANSWSDICFATIFSPSMAWFFYFLNGVLQRAEVLTLISPIYHGLFAILSPPVLFEFYLRHLSLPQSHAYFVLD